MPAIENAPLLPVRLQVAATIALVAFLVWVIRLIRRQRMSLADSLSWFLSTLVALAFTLFPQLLALLARELGIAVPANALFAIAFLYISWNLLALTLATSSQSARVRRVAQECALIRAELEELKRKPGTAG